MEHFQAPPSQPPSPQVEEKKNRAEGEVQFHTVCVYLSIKSDRDIRKKKKKSFSDIFYLQEKYKEKSAGSLLLLPLLPFFPNFLFLVNKEGNNQVLSVASEHLLPN
jgi:hypothetical protein